MYYHGTAKRFTLDKIHEVATIWEYSNRFPYRITLPNEVVPKQMGEFKSVDNYLHPKNEDELKMVMNICDRALIDLGWRLLGEKETVML
jgi:hypothetical protein